jgi:hypothetical protein
LLLQRIAIQPAQSESRAVAQHHLVIAAARDQQLLDALDVDDARAVDTEEALRPDLLDQSGHGLAHQVDLFAGIDAHVVALGLDPVDRLDVDERHAAAGLHEQSLAGRFRPARSQ